MSLAGVSGPILADARDHFPQPLYPIMANMYSDLKSHVESLEDDFSKFYDKGNKAAGTRVRKGMQELKKMAQDIRVDVQEQKNDS